MYGAFILGIILLFSVVITFLFVLKNKKEIIPSNKIYCIMITGQNVTRSAYAKLAIQNFISQTYENKHLIIINQSQSSLISKPLDSRITEYFQSSSQSLGALRNFALDKIPLNGLFTTWDDDDLRSASYLSEFFKNYRPGTIVSLTGRFEYNKLRNVTWAAFKPSGMVLFLAPNVQSVRYMDKPTMEDVKILSEYQAKGFQLIPIPNNPSSYIRLVHGNNTSLFVDKNKDYIVTSKEYYERNTTPDEHEWVINQMSEYKAVSI